MKLAREVSQSRQKNCCSCQPLLTVQNRNVRLGFNYNDRPKEIRSIDGAFIETLTKCFQVSPKCRHLCLFPAVGPLKFWQLNLPSLVFTEQSACTCFAWSHSLSKSA